MDSLINSYMNWIKKNIIVKNVGEYLSVTTPFLDRHNDCIQIYIKKNEDGTIFLTDDGYTISDLESSGFSFNTSRRKELLQSILKSYHLTIDSDNCLTKVTTVNDFPCSKHFFIQAILAINDLYVTNKQNVASLFLDDVGKLFDDNEIAYSYNIKLTGKSGLDHNIDYVLPQIKKDNIPERYIKAINTPDKSNTENNIFLWNDLKEVRKKDNKNNKMFVILNDTNIAVKKDIIEAYNKYDIQALLWSNKKKILKKINSVA